MRSNRPLPPWPWPSVPAPALPAQVFSHQVPIQQVPVTLTPAVQAQVILPSASVGSNDNDKIAALEGQVLSSTTLIQQLLTAQAGASVPVTMAQTHSHTGLSHFFPMSPTGVPATQSAVPSLLLTSTSGQMYVA